MSLFDFPRVNIAGTVQLSPGTANNADNAGAAYLPDGQTLALVDSANVMPITFGMDDAGFIAWVQQPQVFTTTPGGTTPTNALFPAEWNYYGDLSSTVASGAAAVVGVVTAPGEILTAPDPAVPVSSLIGASLTYTGSITDVNSQGSPPATQFFIPQLTLANGPAIALQGPASKGACQWLNFYRNVNAVLDQGAGGYVYHVILKSASSTFDLPGFDDPSIIGAIFRYYLYNPFQPPLTNDQQAQLYQQKLQNPLTLQFVATIAPLFANETIATGPVGRLLAAPPPSITTPTSNNNGQGTIALAPAVVQQIGNAISVEFSGTFPDNFQQPASGPSTNDKFDFGPVALVVTGNETSATIGSVDYTDTAGGNAAGWIFDFDISGNAAAQQALTDPNASFALESTQFGNVLAETDYFIVTNQLAIYAEQNGPRDSFLNQGTTEPATISVYSRGVELSAAACPPLSVWSYATVPLQLPGPAVLVQNGFKPGDPLAVDTSQPGNFDFFFTVDRALAPANWSAFLNPPFTTLTNATLISLRILPNNVDFSSFYVDPNASAPVGNASLTFEVVYLNVLRTYYLLFPAMNVYIQLNDETAVSAAASRILTATDPSPSNWMSPQFMPRTRDLSQSRRTLLQSWCRMVTP